MSGNGKVYKCLNPTGIQEPIETYPLAPRLNAIDGKTIHFSVTGETCITIPMEKRLKNDYPNVNWTVNRTDLNAPIPLTEEQRKTTDAVILGVCW
ncbi:MAG: hypothetical protein V3R96_02730 [Dehalococcoidales bacterium]